MTTPPDRPHKLQVTLGADSPNPSPNTGLVGRALVHRPFSQPTIPRKRTVRKGVHSSSYDPLKFQESESIGQLVVAPVNRRITTLMKELEVVGVDGQRFIKSVANQLAMADVFGPGRHAVFEGDIIDPCEGLRRSGYGIRRNSRVA